MDAFVYSTTLAAIAFVGFLFLRPFDRRLAYVLGVWFAVYIGLNDLVTGLPPEFPVLRFGTFTRWNWFGQIYSMLFSTILIVGLRLTPKAIGMTLPERNIKIGIVALIVAVLPSPIIGFIVDLDPPTASTLAFQGLMPGIAEELAYRGIAPALLLGLVHGRSPASSVPWTVVFVAAIPFGAVHGMGYSDGAFSFAIGPALHTLTGGVIYAWLRFYTGSLLFPVLAHGLGNLSYDLTGFM